MSQKPSSRRTKKTPARQSGRAKDKGSRPSQAASQPTFDEWLVRVATPWRVEIIGLALVMVGAWTVLSLTGLPLGNLSASWRTLLRQVFGWGSWVAAGSLIAGGIHLALRSVGRPWRVSGSQIIGFEILFAASLALTHLSSADFQDRALTLAAGGQGGGYLGWALSVPLVEGLGLLLSWLILTLLWVVGAVILFRVSWQDIQAWLARASERLQRWADSLQPAAPPAPPSKPAVQLELPQPAMTRAKPAAPAKTVIELQELVIARPEMHQARPGSRPAHLPPLDILDAGAPIQANEAEIKEKAAIIENTLMDFGLPVRVVEVRRGPAVTQFGVAPQYIEKPGANGEVRELKVRVSQITSLASDLALALQATRIRMEAPVPGRPIVGIEVPNQENTLVHLRSVIESAGFYDLKSPLGIAMGLDVSGTPISADLAKMPHMLIAGTTGSGKSVCINAITTSLVCNNPPDTLRLVMIDPKMVELVRFNGLPHLLGRVEVDQERIIGVLRWLTLEMDRRYKVLAEAGTRNLADYNRLAGRRKKLESMPHIVMLLDELADLMMMAPEEVEQTLVRLAQMARAVGIHLVVATQRPSTDVVTGLIKANFPARVAFAVASSVDSRVILDSVGAESLLGRGDMLFQWPDAPKAVRIQGCFVSDLEIERVVSFWRQQADEVGLPPDQTAPWEDLLARQAVVEQKDDMLEQAIALAKQNETISTSFIQRQLRIGYPRAARLMDALEELGVVGEEQGAGRTRQVLVSQDDDPLGDYVQNESNGG